ncbi:hypothetical protein P9274_15560, partial [Schinkia azotoformans]|uniref:hypothetical protein n=1 Tax=Schinkia azotoformans TaxID=1454 RepID=UPI002E20DF76|nr:hypothetical protein [Schinkia azotoformans]
LSLENGGETTHRGQQKLASCNWSCFKQELTVQFGDHFCTIEWVRVPDPLCRFIYGIYLYIPQM